MVSGGLSVEITELESIRHGKGIRARLRHARYRRSWNLGPYPTRRPNSVQFFWPSWEILALSNREQNNRNQNGLYQIAILPVLPMSSF
jgi:hypothetical protein